MVDDEEPFTRIVKLQLERSGPYDVCTENDSSKIMETARAFDPDIILLDIVMPGLDGGDVAALLKQDPKLKSVPILIVSALVSPDDASSDAVVQSGDDIIIAKPVRTEKLMAAIQQRLDGRL